MRRFVHGVFDERYITTLGVKIDTKTVEVDSEAVKLVLWDIEGADPADQEIQLVNSRIESYLQGTDGVLLVADGTRPSTIEVARSIHEWFVVEHPGVPVALLLNKSDLTEQWQVDKRCLEGFDGLSQCFTTSALSGENVERTFFYLAEALRNG
jgi:GTPase SAR1 family protein